jgi:hypothetical protein
LTRFSALVAALLLVTGCDIDLFGPEVLFRNQRQIAPLPEYAAWYAAVERCRALHGDYEAVQWFAADSIVHEGGAVAGYQIGHRITIRTDFLRHMTVIRHEVDHHVTRTGNPLHLADGGTACDGVDRATP